MRVVFVVVALGAVVLSGCVTSREEELKKNLDSWIGQPVAAVALNAGPPQSSFDIGPNKRAFQWQTFGQTPGMAMPINGMMVYRAPQQTVCNVSFIASSMSGSASTLADWRIEGWNYNGHC